MFTAVEGDYNSDDNVAAAEKDGGHLTRFGLQECVIVTGLYAGSFLEGDRYTKVLEKRRLKEKYFKSLEKISCAQLEKTFVCASTPRADRYKLGLSLIVKGVITAPDNNVGIDEDTLSLVDDLELFFSYPWAKVGYRRLLKGFRARSVVGPQFHKAKSRNGGHDGSAAGDGHDDKPGAGAEDDETSSSDDRQTPEGNGDDGSKADESGDSNRDTSSETGAGDTEDDDDASGRRGRRRRTEPTDDDHVEEGEMQEIANSFEGLIFELIMCVYRGVMMNFCKIMKSTDKTKAEAKSRGIVISTKKEPKGPKSGFMPEGANVKTITPIPYDVVNDLNGGY
ncbi:Hypothetical predicted protein [Olea europaea subsp. europaea]|uniref:DUF1985 domain-containing protein n=1 Tax=Olea europaea subsp. europaea TaxID=158383 RepID=A0A8S0RJD5_OLEEU|nr:Hypothetical predicted protein [Olea europaea subsp. europaea]